MVGQEPVVVVRLSRSLPRKQGCFDGSSTTRIGELLDEKASCLIEMSDNRDNILEGGELDGCVRRS